VFVDTGQLAAGTYDFEIVMSVHAANTWAVGTGLVVEHRNAANNANVNVFGGCVGGGQVQFRLERVALATNERLRITNPVANAASVRVSAAIGRRVSL
jgi:argininosuccinate synthase